MSKICTSYLSPGKSLQRSGAVKALGRGRESVMFNLASRARVLSERRAAAELSS
jgi:hypothetical protein